MTDEEREEARKHLDSLKEGDLAEETGLNALHRCQGVVYMSEYDGRPVKCIRWDTYSLDCGFGKMGTSVTWGTRRITPEDVWEQFTKRTDEPKLKWLEAQLDEAGIDHRRYGYSFHAPILQVRKKDLSKAWDILSPVDDVEDDDPRYAEYVEP